LTAPTYSEVTITGQVIFNNGVGDPVTVSLTPLGTYFDNANGIAVNPQAQSVSAGTDGTFSISSIIDPTGGAGLPWNLVVKDGNNVLYSQKVQIAFSNGASQNWLLLGVAQINPTVIVYLPVPDGTPAAGQVPASTGNGSETVWTTVAGASGGLLAASNLSDLTSASAARTNLGLGTAATSAATAFDAAGAATAAAAGSLSKSGGTMTGRFVTAAVALTDAVTVSVDALGGNDFVLTLGGNRTIAAPANPAANQRIIFELIQDATGSRTVTWDSVYSFGSGSAPTLSTAASAADQVAFRYSAAKSKWLYLGSNGGF
jgi:hypothetical protein